MTKTELFNLCETHYYDSFRKPLNRCQAEYTDTVEFNDGSQWIILRSYDTIVAAYSLGSMTVYIRDYYSATTVQHISKFVARMRDEHVLECVVYLYHRSDNIVLVYTPGNKYVVRKWGEFHDLVERDYKPLITICENH